MEATHSMPVPMKKTLVLVNAFITDTVRFLNHFATIAEEKIHKVHTDITRVETSLVLLEAKLTNIEGLEPLRVDAIPTAAAVLVNADAGVSSATATAPPTTAAATTSNTTPASNAVPASSTVGATAPVPQAATTASAPAPAPAPAPAATMPTMQQHPSYASFYRLQSMRIPAEALKQKMAMAGLNPDLLDTPDAPITAAKDAISAEMASSAAFSAAPTAATATATTTVAPMAAVPPQAAPVAPAPAPAPAAPAPAPVPAPASSGGGMAIKDDPRYAPFLKMLRMGVPAGAAKLKVAAAGLNPDVLDMDPEAPVPA